LKYYPYFCNTGHTGFDSIKLVVTHVDKVGMSLNTCKQIKDNTVELSNYTVESLLAELSSVEELEMA